MLGKCFNCFTFHFHATRPLVLDLLLGVKGAQETTAVEALFNFSLGLSADSKGAIYPHSSGQLVADIFIWALAAFEYFLKTLFEATW